MCTLANSIPSNEELSTKQILRVIDEAASFGIKEALLTGGEPFLRADIFEICEYCSRKGLRTVITTNGLLIDGRLADKIIDSGIGHIHISLDGLNEAHDYFRGQGAFNNAVNCLKILNSKRSAARRFSIGIACTVMDKNAGQLCEIFKLADDFGADVINFQPVVKDNGRFLEGESSVFWVSDKNLPVLKEEIKKIKAFKSRHLILYEEPSLELLLKYYEKKLSRKDWVCFGGFKTVFVCYSKNEPLVYSCHGICGNLNKVSLKKAWFSQAAYKLRVHSQNCGNLCMQSCYSKEAAGSLNKMACFYFNKIKQGIFRRL